MTYKVYTDGSCMPNPGRGGWGYVIIFPDMDIVSSGGSPHTTNNVMELTAVIELLKDCKEQKEFEIYSDSQYVINCAHGKWGRKKNVELWKEYEKVSEGKKITWNWVKAHNNDYYNEKVDKIAKNAAEKF